MNTPGTRRGLRYKETQHLKLDKAGVACSFSCPSFSHERGYLIRVCVCVCLYISATKNRNSTALTLTPPPPIVYRLVFLRGRTCQVIGWTPCARRRGHRIRPCRSARAPAVGIYSGALKTSMRFLVEENEFTTARKQARPWYTPSWKMTCRAAESVCCIRPRCSACRCPLGIEHARFESSTAFPHLDGTTVGSAAETRRTFNKPWSA